MTSMCVKSNQMSSEQRPISQHRFDVIANSIVNLKWDKPHVYSTQVESDDKRQDENRKSHAAIREEFERFVFFFTNFSQLTWIWISHFSWWRKMCLVSKSRRVLNLKKKIKPPIKQGKMNLSNSFSTRLRAEFIIFCPDWKSIYFAVTLQLRAPTHSVIACVQTTFHTCLSISPAQRVNFLPKLWWWKTHSRVPIKKRKLSHLLCVPTAIKRTRNS